MPSISPLSRPGEARLWIAGLGADLVRTAVWSGNAALAVLILGGEWIPLLDYRGNPISLPMLRDIHVLAGGVLIASALVRLAAWIFRIPASGSMGAATKRGVLAGRPALNGRVSWSGGLLLVLAYWSVICVLLLSGIERFVQFRYGMGVMPGFLPPVWWALHRAARPYLYAVLLLYLLRWSKMTVKRVLDHMKTP